MRRIRYAVHRHIQQCINTLRPRQDGRHFANDIFKCIFLNENVWILIKISLKFIAKGPFNNISALIQIILCQATSHYLNQWWLDYWRIYASLGLMLAGYSQLGKSYITVGSRDGFHLVVGTPVEFQLTRFNHGRGLRVWHMYLQAKVKHTMLKGIDIKLYQKCHISDYFCIKNSKTLSFQPNERIGVYRIFYHVSNHQWRIFMAHNIQLSC